LKKEILFQSDIEKLIGKRPFKTPDIKLGQESIDKVDEDNSLNKENESKDNIDKVDEDNSLNKENEINERNNDLSEK